MCDVVIFYGKQVIASRGLFEFDKLDTKALRALRLIGHMSNVVGPMSHVVGPMSHVGHMSHVVGQKWLVTCSWSHVGHMSHVGPM